MVQQSLDMSRHGRGLGDVGASGVEASLVRVVLDTDLLPLGSHEAVAASDGVRGPNLLPGGTVLVGEAEKYFCCREMFPVLFVFFYLKL